MSAIPAGKKPPASETIPNELVFEILTWLPGKSIARFKCVCKDWLSAIRSDRFRKAYRTRNRGLIMYWCEEIALKKGRFDFDRCVRFYYSSFRRLNEPPPLDFCPQLELKLDSAYNGVTQVVGGLVCCGDYHSYLADDVKLTVHNVFTGEMMKVPDPKSIFCRYNNGFGTASTFHLGYSPMTGEYKILRLLFQRDWNDVVVNLPVMAQTIVLRPSCSGLDSTWKTINYQDSGLAGLGERSKAFYKMVSHHEVRMFSGDGVVSWFRKKEGLILFDFYLEKFWRVKLPKELQHEDRVFVRANFSGNRSVALYVLPQEGEPECFLLDDCDHGIWRKEDVEFPEKTRGTSGDLAVAVADLMLLLMGNQENNSRLMYEYINDKTVEQLRVGNLPNKVLPLDMKGKGPSMAYSLFSIFDARLSFILDTSQLYRSINDVLTDQ